MRVSGRLTWISIWYSGWPVGPKIGRTTNSVANKSVSSVLVIDPQGDHGHQLGQLPRHRGSRFQRRQDSGDTIVQRRMSVIESPRSVAAGADIGEHLPVLVDVDLGKSRRDTAQPTVYLGLVAPCHRHQAERRVDRKALSDNVFTVAGVAHRIDDGQVVVVDARHRAAGGQALVEIDQCGSALLEQGKLVTQATHQSEQAAAQPVATIVVSGDPAPRSSSPSTNAHVDVLMPH